MRSFIPFNREQAFLLPPDLRAWVPEDDLAHFVVAAVERVPLGEFHVIERADGKPQYHPRLMLAVLIHCYAGACPREGGGYLLLTADQAGDVS